MTMKITNNTTKMKPTDISKSFRDGFRRNEFIRIGENRDLSLYIGFDEQFRPAFDFRGNFSPMRLKGSVVIEVDHLLLGGVPLLRFSLTNYELLDYFSIFCSDLIKSTDEIVEDIVAYKTICSRYLSWKKMFRSDSSNLNENEIMGLIGELLFLRDEMFPKYGQELSIISWSGPEKTHKDFAVSNSWYEVKATSIGKSSVTISSIEQLDSDVDGELIVYFLEKMAPPFNGIKINELVLSINEIITMSPLKQLFFEKLETFGFKISQDNDNYVYNLAGKSRYKVNAAFPRLRREVIPLAIDKAKYELSLANIDEFKID